MLSIHGAQVLIKLYVIFPTKPEFPLSISQKELLNVKYIKTVPTVKYAMTKNNFKIILLNSFLIIKSKPQNKKLSNNKKETKPKLCNKKSAMLLP